MPMKPGYSHEVIASNINELVRSGRDPKQSVAIALSEARKHKKMAMGGFVENDMPAPGKDDEMLLKQPHMDLADALKDGDEIEDEPMTAQPYAEGGEVNPDLSEQAINAIMMKKKKRKYIQG